MLEVIRSTAWLARKNGAKRLMLKALQRLENLGVRKRSA